MQCRHGRRGDDGLAALVRRGFSDVMPDPGAASAGFGRGSRGACSAAVTVGLQIMQALGMEHLHVFRVRVVPREGVIEIAVERHYLAADGLQPTSKGARVRFSGKSRTVIDGPFTETKELIAGFWLWKVSSFQEALDWVKRCPNPHEGECEIEVRPVFEVEDFGDAVTPEIRERAKDRRARGARAADKGSPTSIEPERALYWETDSSRHIGR